MGHIDSENAKGASWNIKRLSTIGGSLSLCLSPISLDISADILYNYMKMFQYIEHSRGTFQQITST